MPTNTHSQQYTEAIVVAIESRNGDFTVQSIMDDANILLPKDIPRVQYHVVSNRIQRMEGEGRIICMSRQKPFKYRYISPDAISPDGMCKMLLTYMKQLQTKTVPVEEVRSLQAEADKVHQMQETINKLIMEKNQMREAHLEEIAALNKTHKKQLCAGGARLQQAEAELRTMKEKLRGILK